MYFHVGEAQAYVLDRADGSVFIGGAARSVLGRRSDARADHASGGPRVDATPAAGRRRLAQQV